MPAKCTGLVIIATYSDGQAQTMNILEPAEVNIEVEDVNPAKHEIIHPTRYVLKQGTFKVSLTAVAGERGMVTTIVPISGES